MVYQWSLGYHIRSDPYEFIWVMMMITRSPIHTYVATWYDMMYYAMILHDLV